MDWEGAKPTRSRRGAIAAGLAAALAIGFLVRMPGDTTGPGGLDVVTADPTATPAPTERPSPRLRPTPSPRPSPSPVPELAEEPGQWRRTAPSPLKAQEPMALHWSGREVLVWGEQSWHTGRRVITNEGAAYDPATDRWRRLPPSPLSSREGAASVWTSAGLFEWGGNEDVGHLDDGALYDPAEDRWTVLPASPLSPRSEARAAWTGSEVIVVGGHDNGGTFMDAAAYDPATGAWREIPPPPFSPDGSYVELVGTDGGAFAWQPDMPAVEGREPTMAWFDAGADRWRPMFAPKDFGFATFRAVWTGHRLLLVQGLDPGVRVAEILLPRNRWREIGTTSERIGEPWIHNVTWVGDSVVVATGSKTLRFDPRSGRWSRIPFGIQGGATVWAGDRLLNWGGQLTSNRKPSKPGHTIHVRRLRPLRR